MLQEGRLTESQGKGIVNLIYKEKGQKTDLGNWRPISLLCVDYKILAKILANRLKKTLERIINRYQSGGFSNRCITDNLAITRNIIDNIAPNHAGAILALDFEKAYDKVDRENIYEIMKKLKFPNAFIRHVQTLYSLLSVSK